MIRHIIILGSSYKSGERIALDYPETSKKYKHALDDIKKIRKALKDESIIATHILRAPSDKWEDVVKMDPFFDNIRIVKEEKEFIKLLLKDKELDSIDVAEYILANTTKCSHTKLEKLTYFCYADYLCEYNKQLFQDKIYAFKYGPVIRDVYYKYRKLGIDDLSDSMPTLSEFNIPIKSRILISEDGYNKLASIDKTINKYKDYSTEELINLTHKENTPWAYNDKGEVPYKEISNKDIKKYHCFENA